MYLLYSFVQVRIHGGCELKVLQQNDRSVALESNKNSKQFLGFDERGGPLGSKNQQNTQSQKNCFLFNVICKVNFLFL